MSDTPPAADPSIWQGFPGTHFPSPDIDNSDAGPEMVRVAPVPDVGAVYEPPADFAVVRSRIVVPDPVAVIEHAARTWGGGDLLVDATKWWPLAGLNPSRKELVIDAPDPSYLLLSNNGQDPGVNWYGGTLRLRTTSPMFAMVDPALPALLVGQPITQRTIAVPQPAAGANPATQTVPAGKVWRLRSIFGLLTTSAAVANRIPAVKITDGTNTIAILEGGSGAVTAASSSAGYTWGMGLAAAGGFTGGRNCSNALPDLRLLPGYTVQITTLSIDAADQWTGVSMVIEETNATAVPVSVFEVWDPEL